MFLLTEQHFTEVVGSEEFLNLGMEQVSSLIASDKLTIPTEEKVHALHPATNRRDTTTNRQRHTCAFTLLCRFLKR